MSAQSLSFIAINEFEPLYGGPLDVDTASSSGDETVQEHHDDFDYDGFATDDDAPDCHADDDDEAGIPALTDVSPSHHQVIVADTFRFAAPQVDCVMPVLEELLPALPPAASTAVSTPAVLKSYRHNPYNQRVIPCRMTAPGPDEHAGTSAFDSLPLCGCALGLPAAAPTAPSTSTASTEPSKKVMCCYYKQKGYCKMGEKCWYGHDGDLYTPCHYGASCKAGHATLALMNRQPPVAFSQSAAMLTSSLSPSVRVGVRPVARFGNR